MVKRIIAIMLSICLLGLNMVYAEDNLNAFYNVTTPDAWTDTSSGMTYLYGGNIEFRFKNRGHYAPWIWGEAPKFKIGCGGMSISGGFLSLLGLNDIKEQLQNAGALFAWGVMMTINVSMPTVAKVFESIRAWATKIQQLLANACKLGTEFAKKNNIGFDLLGPLDKAVADGFETLKNNVDSNSKYFGWLRDFAEEITQDNGDNKKKVDSHSAETIKIIQTSAFGVSMASFIFGKYLKNLDIGKKYLQKADLNNLYKGKLANYNIPGSGTDEYNHKVVAHKLIMLLYGDIVADGKSLKDYLSKFTQDGKINKDALVSKLMSIKMGTYVVPEISLRLVGPAIDPQDAGIALVKGFSAIKNNAVCENDTCYFKNRKLLYIELPKAMPSKASNLDASSTTSFGTFVAGNEKIKALVLTSEEVGGKNGLVWKGLYQASLHKIRSITRSVVGSDNYTWYTSFNSNDDDSNAVIFTPNVRRYIEVIAKIEKKYHGENSYTYHLKEILARYSAILAAKFIANTLPTIIRQAIDENTGPGSQKTFDILSQYLHQVEQVNKHIYKALDDMKKDQLDVYYINQLFESIEKKIKKESLSHLEYK